MITVDLFQNFPENYRKILSSLLGQITGTRTAHLLLTSLVCLILDTTEGEVELHYPGILKIFCSMIV